MRKKEWWPFCNPFRARILIIEQNKVGVLPAGYLRYHLKMILKGAAGGWLEGAGVSVKIVAAHTGRIKYSTVSSIQCACQKSECVGNNISAYRGGGGDLD